MPDENGVKLEINNRNTTGKSLNTWHFNNASLNNLWVAIGKSERILLKNRKKKLN